MQVTATQAKNRFGALCAQAKTEPVFVEKDGRIDTVILSAQMFYAMQAATSDATLGERKTRFEQTHSAWLAEQNQRFEAHGSAAGLRDRSHGIIAAMDAVLSGI